MSAWFMVMVVASVAGFGLVAGIFFAFSDFIMRSLAQTAPASAIAAMQGINRTVYRSVFYYLLWGMLAAAVGVGGYAVATLDGPVAGVLIVGSVLYFAGVLVVSFAVNVPLNHRLEAMDADSADTAGFWAGTYVPRWTIWNHVRTATSAASSLCYLAAAGLLLLNG